MCESLTLEKLNFEVNHNLKNYILKCEEGYRFEVKRAIENVCKNKASSLIMLAGPSSSGKTTTAALLKKYANECGRQATVISLDDFYLDQTDIHYFEDGTPDFETLDALDKEYIKKSLNLLLTEHEARLPKFSFVTKRREKNLTDIKIQKDEIVIVEGLHAMNPEICNSLPTESITKIYVSVSSRIFNNESVIFSKRDLRLMRRIIRDFHFRCSSVENTLMLWKGVRMGEDRYLFPFSTFSDIRINSFHGYEACLFKDEAIKLLSAVKEESEYYAFAQDFILKLLCFESINQKEIPVNSLLHEFIG